MAPAAWLTTALTRLCLNHLGSARLRRESYLGPWLPEPVRTPDETLGPADSAAQRDSVSLALLVAMERLGPAERAVYVLREAFGYSHRDVASIIDVSEASCRQLLRRGTFGALAAATGGERLLVTVVPLAHRRGVSRRI